MFIRFMIMKSNVKNFFGQYALRMNNALAGDQLQVNGIVSSFGDYFVGANPTGVVGGKNDASLKAAIENGISFYKRIGIKAMNILSCEITALDDDHAMAKVFWQSVYEGAEGKSSEITFTVTYIVQELEKRITIFAYITGDEQKVLKDLGLL
jgi:hypothetical protein